jgi:hypothetical protein
MRVFAIYILKAIGTVNTGNLQFEIQVDARGSVYSKPPRTHAHVSSHVCYDLASVDTDKLRAAARSCITFTIFSSLQRGRSWVSCEETSTSGKTKAEVYRDAIGRAVNRNPCCSRRELVVRCLRRRLEVVTCCWIVRSFGVRLLVDPVVVSPTVPVPVSFYIRHGRTLRD